MEGQDEDQKKYIRTYEGDMEILKKGGKPDLAPLPEKEEIKGTALEKSKPIPPPPPPKPEIPPPAAPEPPKPEVPLPPPPQEITPSAEFPQSAPAVEVSPLSPPAYTTPPLKTYAGDFTEQVQNTGASAATILAAEGDAGKVAEPIPVPPSHGLLYGIAGTILLIAGGVGAYYAYLQYSSNITPAPVVKQTIATPIVFDTEEAVTGTDGTLLQTISASVANPISAGAIRYLSLASSSPNESVFTLLKPNAPDILLRNVRGQGSVAGVVTVTGTQSPFFILSVSSYSDTFSGMLQWEGSMLKDTNMSALYPFYPLQSASSTATKSGSSTSSLPQVLAPFFHDEVVNNHDTRVYRDPSGKSIVMYGYWDPSTLIIARDPAAFTLILERLATAHATQ